MAEGFTTSSVYDGMYDAYRRQQSYEYEKHIRMAMYSAFPYGIDLAGNSDKENISRDKKMLLIECGM